MWWLRKRRPRAGRKAQQVSGSKELMITLLGVAVSKGKLSQMEVVEDFESIPYKAVFCG